MRILYSPLPDDQRIISGLGISISVNSQHSKILVTVHCIVDLNEASEYLGESGAVCLGALYTLMTDTGAEAREMRAALGLSEGSRVLCVSTEGDTDPEGFRDNIWG